MKKITLLVASIFLFGGIVANATERNNRKSSVDFRNAAPIVFTERGIEFLVFPNGQFDFNTRPSNSEMYYKSGRRNGPNKTYETHGYGQKWNNGVEVEQNRSGKITRIGNVFVNYDSRNRIKRIGSVNMDYNRYGLTQVGGLQIVYNRRGQIVDVFGTVKRGSEYQYSQKNNDDNDHYQNSKNQDYNYYRTNGTKANKVVGILDVRINI